MKRQKFDTVLNAIAECLKVIAHPARIRLIGLLHQKEMDVSELHKAMGLSQSAVSNHLKLLKLKGLVVSKQVGKHHVYRLTSTHIAPVITSAIRLQATDIIHEDEAVQLLNEMELLLQPDAQSTNL